MKTEIPVNDLTKWNLVKIIITINHLQKKKLIFIFIFLIDKGQKFNIKNDKFVIHKHFQFQGKKHFP